MRAHDKNMSKNLDRIKSVAVYCGSRTPMKHAFEEAAAELAKFVASHGMTLIFGGSNVGTMRTVADAALAAGGKVVGVFTTNLPMSLAHLGLTELVVTHSLAERKRARPSSPPRPRLSSSNPSA